MMRLASRRRRHADRGVGAENIVRNAAPPAKANRYNYATSVHHAPPSPGGNSHTNNPAMGNHHHLNVNMHPAAISMSPGHPSSRMHPSSSMNHLNMGQVKDGKTAVRFQWSGGSARSISLVGSFDAFMHHKMNKISLGQRSGPATFEVSIRIAPGVYSYKFLVDGTWRTDTNSAAAVHPVVKQPDGTLSHRFEVKKPAPVNIDASSSYTMYNQLRHTPQTPPLTNIASPNININNINQYGMQHASSSFSNHLPLGSIGSTTQSGHLSNALDLADGVSPVVAEGSNIGGYHSNMGHPSNRYRQQPVVRSSSVSDLHKTSSNNGRAPYSTQYSVNNHNHTISSSTENNSFSSLNSRQNVLNTPTNGHHMNINNMNNMINGGGNMGMGGGVIDRNDRPSSFMAPSPSSAQRKSLLPRFMRRFSGRHHSNISEALDFSSCGDKENEGVLGNTNSAHGYPGMSSTTSRSRGVTPERKVGRGLRASGRAQPVQISGPTQVDKPTNAAEVNRDADVWRQMAKELADNLHDPSGARELLQKAIKHREAHGLWCTAENAQTHVDLARNLSKNGDLPKAEFHLRIALRIYKRIDGPGNNGAEHIGDLLHYIGVVVDRQKTKRQEAEQLYRMALDTYKANRLTGNNVDIALKNLSLNLRKQGREREAEIFVREYTSAN